MALTKNKFIYILILLVSAAILRFGLMAFLGEANADWFRIVIIILILGIGAIFTLRGIANIIEETTEVLHERTHLAGGLLQSFGTAFPDMVLGIVAAVISLQLQATNQIMAINYAIIAAATTFGSNIYNIIHAAWCIYRQNLANRFNKSFKMIPGIKYAGSLKPMAEHQRKPSLGEFDAAITVSTALTVLTGLVAVSMVIFGQVKLQINGLSGDLYQLIRPIGVVVFILAVLVLYYFRQSKHERPQLEAIIEEEKFFTRKSSLAIWLSLAVSGVAILLTAESMVRAIEVFCTITGLPFVIAGVLAGIIGCLGEMIVVHNFSVNPNGRIGDAVVGVAMDNIMTIIGAAVVAILGGIFLGGNALILIFVIILTANSVLIWQISKLKNYLLLNK